MRGSLRSLVVLAGIALLGISSQACLAHATNEDQQTYERPEVAREPGDRQAVAEIKKVFDGVTEAAARRDVEALGRFFHPDATVIDLGGRTVGWESYREKVLPSQFQLLPEDSNYPNVSGLAISAQGNFGWATYRFQMDAITEQGRQQVFGFGTAVFQRERGEWKVIALQTAGRALREGERLDWASIDGLR